MEKGDKRKNDSKHNMSSKSHTEAYYLVTGLKITK